MGLVKNVKIYSVVLIALALVFIFPLSSLGKETKKEKKAENEFDIPSHVLSISKENTFPNSTEDQEIVEPSKSTKNLMEDAEIEIQNPELIKMLNESTVKPSPIGFGYRGMVYLGRWPLHYKSLETTVNWEYQPINTNEINNIGGDEALEMSYTQENEKEITGALTNKINNPDDIRKMMLLTAKDKTKLPLSYKTVIGKDTKKENTYNVPIKKIGELKAYSPAVNEKGQVVFGDVYFKLKGTKKSIQIKNVTKQGIGAWIPVQDHVSFSFQVK
ncbi:MAG TPA: YfkD family protein [Bacillota bacterium]|nr:YfkD family protein [Bacillota bacterium]